MSSVAFAGESLISSLTITNSTVVTHSENYRPVIIGFRNKTRRRTLAFSCGARATSKLKEMKLLEKHRRQLQGVLGAAFPRIAFHHQALEINESAHR